MQFCKDFLFSCFFFSLILLIAPTGATPYPILLGGQVTGLNETNHTLTITTDCDRFTCDRTMPEAYEGRVPHDPVFSSLRKGDSVVVMFKSWMGEYPCDMGEYKDKCTISDHDPIPVGRWEGISRVVQERGTGRWLATDLFGDPGANPVPLIHNYSLEYAPGPDITVCPVSQPLWECTAGYLNISLMHSNTTVAETRALRNETFEYEDPYDQTTVTLQFFEGKATPQQMPSPGGCPCTDMEVHLQPVPALKSAGIALPARIRCTICNATNTGPVFLSHCSHSALQREANRSEGKNALYPSNLVIFPWTGT
ncbi:MAG TPA: hypothetical protein P5013_01815 [Methanoregula sp.]|nr:hypothetical protein [Methanoregula sp.]